MLCGPPGRDVRSAARQGAQGVVGADAESGRDPNRESFPSTPCLRWCSEHPDRPVGTGSVPLPVP